MRGLDLRIPASAKDGARQARHDRAGAR